jgi:transposase-like protein
MAGMRPAARIVLSSEERATLEQWARGGKTEQRMARRARILLAAADGEQTVSIAVRLGERATTVSKWRQRFAKRGLDGLDDLPRSGQPRRAEGRSQRLAELIVPRPVALPVEVAILRRLSPPFPSCTPVTLRGEI